MIASTDNMAEENQNEISAAMPDADTPVPPIDNIHAPKPEPDVPQLPDAPQEPVLPQVPQQMGEHLDTEMAEAAVSIPCAPEYVISC